MQVVLVRLPSPLILGGKLADGASDKQKADWQVQHEAVIKAGGLHIVGTERNESRRVDNQLRGRSGRQGDVGSTRFYLSLEDNLMRIFASDKMAAMMQRLGMEKGEAIEHKMVNRAIENAQKKVEGMNYDARKNLLEYDDVANDQRRVIYQLRDELMGVEYVKVWLVIYLWVISQLSRLKKIGMLRVCIIF